MSSAAIVVRSSEIRVDVLGQLLRMKWHEGELSDYAPEKLEAVSKNSIEKYQRVGIVVI